MAEPPFITALKGIASDVADSQSFDFRLSHCQRLPPVFDRLLSSSPLDIPAAVDVLRDDEILNGESSSLLTSFVELTLAEEMRTVVSTAFQPFLRFCAVVLDDLLSRTNDIAIPTTVVAETDYLLKHLVDSALRLLLSQVETTGYGGGEGDGVMVAKNLTPDYLALKNSFAIVENVVERHGEELALSILTNEDFFRLLISDSPFVSVFSVSIFTRCVSRPSFRFDSLSSSALAGFLDELSFKISSTENAANASISVEALLSLAEKGKDFVDFVRRYEGLETLIARWASRGFDSTIRRLLSLLSPPSATSPAFHKPNAAAVVIQSAWRGYVVRRRMKRLRRIVSDLQLAFKRRRAEKLQTDYNADEAALNSSVQEATRLRQLRASREEELRSVRALPAKEVDDFLRRRESEAASKIQAVWKGWRTRAKMAGTEALKREAAARLLQRHFRNWAKGNRARDALKKKTTVGDELSSDDNSTTVHRRERLSREVEERKERRLKLMRAKRIEKSSENGNGSSSREELNALDMRVRDYIAQKNRREREVSRSLLRCQATIATLDMDLDLILYSSSLEDLADRIKEDPLLRQLATPSISAAIRSEAATEHAKSLRFARQPWTKYLEGEEGEKGEEEIGALEKFGWSCLTTSERKQFAESPYWKHLSWTLEDAD